MPEMHDLPALRLKPREDKRLRIGHLWVFSNEVDISRTPLQGHFLSGTHLIAVSYC